MDTIPHDRPLSERRLVVYRKILADGGFRPVTWAKCRCKETGATYRVNGKHTSVMLSSMASIPEFYVTVESYEAETLEDVAKLYSTFDSQAQTRTAKDVYLSFAGTVPELRNVPGSLINVATSGICYGKFGDKIYSMTAPERGEVILDHVEFLTWLNDIMRPNVGNNSQIERMLKRSSVIAAMLLTWDKDPKKATEFWEAVRDETGPSPEDPDRRLARFLVVTAVNRGPGSRRNMMNRVDTREMFVKTLKWWNAWREGEKPKNVHYNPDHELPKAV